MTLHEVRLKQNLSQDILAERANISQTQLSFIERGKVMPHVSTRMRIEEVLGRKVDWISTRLQGTISGGYFENDSSEEVIIKALNSFIKSAQASEQESKFMFLEDFIKRYKKRYKKQILTKKGK